ncbi:AAA family ATPase [Paraburkholderia sp. BL21I4N1]|uniref:AAA family ATPase n=1 Tax=Paraburkholderia sp. BL21I4N1 TaxID=1938801 RepID=UPI000CFB1820|nr:AAA family ATPase [Paraburkholderia sp. BL21I4N1]PQV44930.1 5-methylcytosine-specific restriction protein B [Paraburkholderia sp. BL21I4N1]
MIDNYLNKDGEHLFGSFRSDADREWAWQVIECIRERYPEMDQWTAGGPNYNFTDLRFGRRKLGHTAWRVGFRIHLAGGRPACGMAEWLCQGSQDRPVMSPMTHPELSAITGWLDGCKSRIATHASDLSGQSYRPSDYGPSAPPIDDSGNLGRPTLPSGARPGTGALNLILYGPPGTGKTYSTIDEALHILDPDLLARYPELAGASAADRLDRRSILKTRFDELAQAGRVRFVTFHQSFSYEDFVEGIRANTLGNGQLSYQVIDGVFKELCNRASVPVATSLSTGAEASIKLSGRRIWKMSLGAAEGVDSYVYDDCIKQGVALLGYGYALDYTGCASRAEVSARMREHGRQSDGNDYAATAVNNFINAMSTGDLIVVTDGNLKFRAIGEITGPYQHIEREVGDDYRQSRPVRWLRSYEPSLGFGELMDNRFSQMTLYQLRDGSINMTKLDALLAPESPLPEAKAMPYVLIIDEINRGNVSRIFGELITLIEASKRVGNPEALSVTLPYSQKPFAVPDNVYLVGTMNTADRSLAGLDIALRRRFLFREMPPRAALLNDVDVEGVNIGQMLAVMNERIELLLDRDHLLGHAYFMPLTAEGGNKLETLAGIFRSQVLPLLQEYFFEDWERIVWVLNDHRKADGQRFIRQRGAPLAQLFGVEQAAMLRDKRWEVNDEAFSNIATYAGILIADA